MRASLHMAASAVAGAAGCLAVSPGFGASLFLSGSLLDVDHAELFLSSGLPATPRAMIASLLHNERSLGERYGFRRRIPAGWSFPVLHSVELILLYGLSGLLLGDAILTGIAAGAMLHILMDLGNYPESPFFFSLVWRGIARRRLMAAWSAREPQSGL